MYDVAIIGCGPAGLFASFEAGMKKMSCIMFDSLPFIGGQCAALYPEKPIYDIPAFAAVTGQELVENLAKQAARFSPKICLEEEVTGYKKTTDGFVLETNRGGSVPVKAIVIASGGGKFGANKPPLEHLEEFERAKSVMYMVGAKEELRGKDVVIAGGGDSAVDWAIVLSNIAKSVKFVHRREKFRASPESVCLLEDLIKAGKVELIVPFQLEKLHGQAGRLEAVEVKSLKGESKMLKADVLLPFFGLAADVSALKSWGLQFEGGQILVEPCTMRAIGTHGIYAIGDIAHYQNKLKLILTGFAEGATAMNDIKRSVLGEEMHFQHSTSMF